MNIKKDIKEYFKELKIIYILNEVTIYNYESIYSLCSDCVILKSIKVVGKDLKVVYQDKFQIVIKGKIDRVEKVDLDGI